MKMSADHNAEPLTDAAGVVHQPAGASPRIVSLVPSLSELLFELDLGDNLVGRTAFCVEPADRIGAVPSVGGTKKIRWQRLEQLAPSHVLFNIDETPKALAERLAAAGIEVVVTHPIEPQDNISLFRLLGDLFDRRAQAQAAVSALERELAATRRLAETLPGRDVLYLIWHSPWMTVSRDTYIANMLALAGMRTIAHDPENRYPVIDDMAALLPQADQTRPRLPNSQ